MIDIAFTFTAKCWLWQEGKGSWHFITLPQDKSEEIKFFTQHLHDRPRGWGAVHAHSKIGNTTWQTSIFPSSTLAAYILPIKAEVRKKEKVLVDNELTVYIKVVV